ncbi:MAG: nucleotide exchange factor GrpE [Patescibacteria group bacterium]
MINQPQTELEKCQQQAEEYLNNWQRERADFANYKKAESKRLEEFVKFANVGLILEMIEVLDDLEIVAKNNENNEGLKPVLKKFQDLLAKYGAERIKVENKFDPNLHEAVTAEAQNGSAETQNTEGEEKLEEIRAGYKMNGRVIRPARVKIIK